MKNDRLSPPEFEILRNAAEDNFADLARQHDRLLASAVEHFDRNARETNASEASQGMHRARLADAIKAIMQVRFPEASDAWFNE